MKKILSLCLALLCMALPTAAALTSCGSDSPESTTAADQPAKPQNTTPALETDYREPSFPDVGVYIDYVANNSLAGKVEGGGTHRVDTKPAGTVRAVANLGYRFAGWSDGVKDATRTGDTADKSKQIVALFEYEALELPILSINTETGGDVYSKTEYIGADLSVFNTDDKHCLDGLEMQIRGRGNKTWEYEKKSYKMKLSEKQSLLGLGEGKAKKWVLLANVCDQSLLRNYTTLLLADSMPAKVWSPDTASVDVYLNGEYRGVYLLCEEIDVNSNKISVPEDLTGAGADDIGFLVEISGNPKEPKFSCNDRSYQIHSDLSTNSTEAREQQKFIEDYVSQAWQAVQEGDEQKIAELIDIDSLVNAYLIEEISKNLDCGYDSFYLYRMPGGKLVFGPVWDFDNALGNANEGTENYYDLYAAYNERFQNNPWLYTAMNQEWFRARVVKMWDEAKGVTEKLSATVLSAGKAGYKSYCRNFEKWDLFGRTWNRETEQITSLKNYTEHYEFLAKWIDQRLNWLDECFHADTFLTEWTVPEKPETGGGGWIRPDPPQTEWAPPITEGIGNEAADELQKNHSVYTVDYYSIDSTIEGYFNEWCTCLFDGDLSTKYCCTVGSGGGWWGEPSQPGELELYFDTAVPGTLTGYTFVTANDTDEYPQRNPNTWVLYGQVDGQWVEIDRSSAAELGMGGYNHTAYGRLVENAPRCSSYKLVITHAGVLQLSEMVLYTQ